MSFQSEILESNPTNYWPMIDGSLVDLIQGSNLSGNVPTLENGVGPEGSNVFNFDGSSNYLSVLDPDVLIPKIVSTNINCAIECFVRNKRLGSEITGFAQIGVVVARLDRSTSPYYGQGLNWGKNPPGATWSQTHVGFSGSELANGTAWNAGSRFSNEWLHVVASYQGNYKGWTIYINGEQMVRDTSGSPYTNTPVSEPLFIGGRNDGVQFFKGNICHVAWYENVTDLSKIINRTLTTGKTAPVFQNFLFSNNDSVDDSFIITTDSFGEQTSNPFVSSFGSDLTLRAKGTGKISGVVKTNFPPLESTQTRVYLIRRTDMQMVDCVWSDPISGYYEFNGFDKNVEFMVVASYPDSSYNAVVLDRVRPI